MWFSRILGKPMKKIILFAMAAFVIANPSYAKIERSEKAKAAFKFSHPCPANGNTSGACDGYVIDHIVPLACGGLDDSSNMQWQTEAEGKAKDKWERKGCETGSHFSASSTIHAPSADGRQYFTGKRGGCYYLDGDKKHYVEHSFCGR
jgi:hypothetical protein